MADLVVECDFLEIIDMARNRASGESLQKMSSMYTTSL